MGRAGVRGRGTRDAHATTNLGSAHKIGILPGNILGALQMLRGVGKGHALDQSEADGDAARHDRCGRARAGGGRAVRGLAEFKTRE